MGRALFLLLIILEIVPTEVLADDAANCRMATGDDAIAACSRIIESSWYRGQNLAIIYNNRGVALDSKGEYDRAISDLDEAIRLDPKLAVAYNNRGMVWYKRKDYDSAIVDYNEAIRLDPNLAKAYKNRAVTWLEKKNYDRAIADFDVVLKLTSQPAADDYFGRGLASLQQKHYDIAIADFNQAIRLNPQPAALYFAHRAWAWIQKKNYDRAIGDLNDAIRLDPKLAVAFNNRGFAFNNKGEFDRAIKDLNEAIRLDPKSANGYKNRGMSFEGKGDLEEALIDFRTALNRNPQYQEAAAGITRIKSKLAISLQTERQSAEALTGRAEATVGPTQTAGQAPPTTSASLATTSIPQGEAEKAALVKVMKDAVAARHGGVPPKTMSEEDAEVAAQAAIKWKAKRDLEAMKVKSAPSNGYADIYIAKGAIKSALRDPDSAVFGNNVFYANDRKMNGYYVPVVCGSVNAKNGFGGMSGQKKFVFFPTLEGRVALEGSVPDSVIVNYWNKMCAGKHD